MWEVERMTDGCCHVAVGRWPAEERPVLQHKSRISGTQQAVRWLKQEVGMRGYIADQWQVLIERLVSRFPRACQPSFNNRITEGCGQRNSALFVSINRLVTDISSGSTSKASSTASSL